MKNKASFLSVVAVLALTQAPVARADEGSGSADGSTSAEAPIAAIARRLSVDLPSERPPVLQGALLGTALGAGTLMALSGGERPDARAVLFFAGVGALGGSIGGAMTPRVRGSSFVEPGEMVRINRGVGLRGRFLRADDLGVVLQLDDGTEKVIPFDDGAFEVRRSTNLARAGAVSGLAIGGAIGVLVYALCEGECGAAGTMKVAAVVGLGGAAAGALVGVLIPSNDWRRLTPEARERAAVDSNPKSRVSFALAPVAGKGVHGAVRLAWR
jgi:hypothetical protein